MLAQRRGQCGIIYARLRATCDWLAKEIESSEVVEVAAYHAGKDAGQRSRVRGRGGWARCSVMLALTGASSAAVVSAAAHCAAQPGGGSRRLPRSLGAGMAGTAGSAGWDAEASGPLWSFH